MVANVTRIHAFHVQTAQDDVNSLKGPDPHYTVLKFGNNLSSKNYRDMAQNVISQGCDFQRSRSSMKDKSFSIRPPPPTHSTYVKFHQNLSASFCVMVEQSLTERWPGKETYDRNTLTHVDSL